MSTTSIGHTMNGEIMNNHNMNKSIYDFENYLQEMFMKDEPESVGTKDDFEENFNRWIERMFKSELVAYATRYYIEHPPLVMQILGDDYKKYFDDPAVALAHQYMMFTSATIWK